jgi:hypothetical protein
MNPKELDISNLGHSKDLRYVKIHDSIKLDTSSLRGLPIRFLHLKNIEIAVSILSSLTHLKNATVMPVGDMRPLAKLPLTKLHVNRDEMDIFDVRALNSIKTIKHLEISSDIYFLYGDSYTLNLPNMRSLCIRECTFENVHLLLTRQLTKLHIWGCRVDIKLDIIGQLANLEDFALYMRMRPSININFSFFRSLKLKKLKLQYFDQPGIDCSLLSHMPLEDVSLIGGVVRNIAALESTKLKSLIMETSRALEEIDFKWARSLPLHYVELNVKESVNLRGLEDCPLNTLICICESIQGLDLIQEQKELKYEIIVKTPYKVAYCQVPEKTESLFSMIGTGERIRVKRRLTNK